MVTLHTIDKAQHLAVTSDAIWRVLENVPDPEIPVISIVDLGIVRTVDVARDGSCTVTLTPTYSGCPATEVIAADVREALSGLGCERIIIKTQLSPAWTTEWINDAAKEKLKAYGIAPPHTHEPSEQRIGIFAIGGLQKNKIACPRCACASTETISQYGSTPCKAQYRCLACKEPFDYFKPH